MSDQRVTRQDYLDLRTASQGTPNCGFQGDVEFMHEPSDQIGANVIAAGLGSLRDEVVVIRDLGDGKASVTYYLDTDVTERSVSSLRDAMDFLSGCTSVFFETLTTDSLRQITESPYGYTMALYGLTSELAFQQVLA